MVITTPVNLDLNHLPYRSVIPPAEGKLFAQKSNKEAVKNTGNVAALEILNLVTLVSGEENENRST